MEIRGYDPKKDRDAVLRIHREAGWLGEGKKEEQGTEVFIKCGRALVAEVHGEAECFVLTVPGDIRYLNETLPLCVVASVITSRVARRQGLARRATAWAVAADAADGALVATLGVFDQGYYNRLGFGNGSYEHWATFDPAHLRVGRPTRIPRRITADDWAAAHAARLARLRGHGSCNVYPPGTTHGEMLGDAKAFGLGYCDGPAGELTHYLWCRADDERDAYHIQWAIYRSREEFLELMALVHSLGDQVYTVRMREPPGIQIQDLIERPFRQHDVTERSKHERGIHAFAWWQARICDLEGCLARTHLPGDEVRFNLVLSDPIERFLDEDMPWRSVAGNYVITLGPSSSAEPGSDEHLPTLVASVGAFTRLWLGVRPATGLAFTDELAGPPELLHALDRALLLPEPKPDWDY